MGVKVSMTINVMDDGQVGIVGPLQDKVLCYGLLEVARDVIQNYKADVSPLVVPKLVRVSELNKGN